MKDKEGKKMFEWTIMMRLNIFNGVMNGDKEGEVTQARNIRP